MSTGMNFAARPCSTRLLLQESGCSRITGLIPKDTAISKVNLLPGRPAVTKTTVAPRISCLRRFLADSSACVSSFLGTFASIWKVAVGKSVRIASSLSSAVSGGGNRPGDAKSISASNLLRSRPEAPTRLGGMSVSMACTRGSVVAVGPSSKSITMSKSTGSADSAEGRRRGIGDAQSKAVFGEASHDPCLVRCSFMASS
mmetsp:Transcript_54773/g.130847  ORF Transcript_54773/g.130847 Transcript_54773/m.130847 type:complete len:200 (+) Transcript_54773:1332-1931(+)